MKVVKDSVTLYSLMMESVDIKNVPRFAGMPVPAQEWLCGRVNRHTFKKGQLVFAEGDVCDSFYLVETGMVRVFKVDGTGREFTLDIFYQGDPVAEVVLMDDTHFPASAIAVETTTILTLSRVDFFELFNLFPETINATIKTLSLRIRSLSRRVQELGGGEVEQRLALVALSIAKKTHPNEENAVCDLSRQELASLVGARVETVIRIISKWAKAGISNKTSSGLSLNKKKLSEILKKAL